MTSRRSPMVVAAGVFACVLALGATPAWAAKPLHPGGGNASGGGGKGRGGGGSGSGSTTGIDVSWPQCPATSLPSGEAFAIVGVNGGLANDYNPCLGAEYAYASTSTGTTSQAKAQVYLNTADPGPAAADWPASDGSLTVPTNYGSCSYGASSDACAWVYGYDLVVGSAATQVTFASSTTTVTGDGPTLHSATGVTLGSQPVWLDVETANTWQADTTMNVADLQGMVAALQSLDSKVQIGVYSTSYQWGQIVGTTSLGTLSGLAVWIPGARNERGAVSNCSQSAFTGGTVMLTQWFGTYDSDYSCVG